MTRHSATKSSDQPLGAGRDLRRRLLLHHLPIALASAGALVLFMTLSAFNVTAYPHADILSGALPRQDGDHGAMDHGGGTSPGMMHHGGHHMGPMDHGGHHMGSMSHGGDRLFTRQFIVASGYIALGLLALTLLIGPANLLLRRRTPVSNYLSRDVGTWAAIFSVVHLVVALEHANGSGMTASFLQFFVAPNGGLLTNSFGLGNWTGLVALVIVLGLLAISNDFALRKLKAGPWKQLQRLNYALFALVILHAFFYGALLRMTSPFTQLLGLSVIAVFVAQTVGIWLWRRKFGRKAATITSGREAQATD